MFNKFFDRLFNGSNERDIKKMRQLVEEKINPQESALKKLSDSSLANKTNEFKARLAKGETLDDILPDAFAVIREASRRVLGMRQFDVQLIGGIILHRGNIAEMGTGEGKTLVATAPVYLNALEIRLLIAFCICLASNHTLILLLLFSKLKVIWRCAAYS